MAAIAKFPLKRRMALQLLKNLFLFTVGPLLTDSLRFGKSFSTMTEFDEEKMVAAIAVPSDLLQYHTAMDRRYATT